jgi:ADP-ribose pyrophosphatase YjhB (NUDIX family)
MVERRAVDRHDRMICFDDGAERFHMRAAGIAIREGRVLLQRAEGDGYWILPGGRMEQGETSAETVLREMQEELQQNVKVGQLAFVLESFFAEGERSFHEIGFYHPMTVPDAFPLVTDGICRRIHDGGLDIDFAWLPADEMSLVAAPFYPVPLRPLLAGPRAGPLHIVDRRS